MDFVTDNRSGTGHTPSLKILVVDDDALNQRMMQVLLQREGYQVDVASSGLAALETIKVEKYDIVFMDLHMPDMDGIETSRRIREWESGNQHIFIVALTASYLPEIGQTLFEVGIDNYVSKPFEVEHIQRLLKYARSSSSNQTPIPSPQPASDEVLDIQRGIERVGGDRETYKELLSDFIQEWPERLRAIQHSFARKDLEGLSRAAHNLNGIAANLGALQLSEYAKRLDKQSIAGYTDSIGDLLREIQAIGSKLLETSSNFLDDNVVTAKSL